MNPELDENLLLACGLLFLGSMIVSLILTPLMKRLARYAHLVDIPGTRKIHREQMPYGGGVAIWLSITGTLAACHAAVSLGGWAILWDDLRDAIAPHVAGIVGDETLWKLLLVLGGGTVMFVLGLIDDFHRLSPRTKLVVQLATALAVALGGIRATLFIHSTVLTLLLTVGWIVFVTNAFNFLDNMDGLSAGVAAIAGALFFVVSVQTGQLFVAALLAVFVGALAGFLRYNLYPAKLFMGDAGSLFIGFILACLTVATTFYEGRGSLYAAFMPALILGVPLFDAASVIVIRLLRGRSIFVGDTNHFSHRLVRLGFSRRGAVVTIYLLGLILGGLATLLRQVDTAGAVVIFCLALGIILLIVLLEVTAAQQDR